MLTSRFEKPVEKFLKYFTARRQEKILRYKIYRPIEEVLIERDKLGKPYVVNSKFKITITQNFFTAQDYQQLCNVDGWT
ncbi:MAG: hypothetical protein IJK81_09400 [Selenomonadaceae bacterium]|nr:hypothetical protein [Selenomonadaceae bacterium]